MRLWRWPTPDWGHAHWFYRFLKASIEGLLKVVFRVNAKGMERIPREGGAIYAMNHFSWIDPFMVGDASPRPTFFLAKEGLFKNRLMAWFMNSMGMIKVDRERGGNDAALHAAKGLIEKGLVVGVYAEGTRSHYDDMLPFKTGVARLALATGAPVVPVALLTHHLWPRGPLLPRVGKRVYVAFGEPLRFGAKGESLALLEGDAEKRVTAEAPENDRELCQEVTSLIEARVKALVHEAEAAYQEGERWRW